MICNIDIHFQYYSIWQVLHMLNYFEGVNTTEKTLKLNIFVTLQPPSYFKTVHDLLLEIFWKYLNRSSFMDHICPQLLHMQYLSNILVLQMQ